jgi:hypothetical protein
MTPPYGGKGREAMPHHVLFILNFFNHHHFIIDELHPKHLERAQRRGVDHIGESSALPGEQNGL